MPTSFATDQAAVTSDDLRIAVDAVDDAIFMLDQEMRCTWCNRRIRNWLGISDGGLTRAGAGPVTALFGDDLGSEGFRQQFQEALAKGSGFADCHIHPAGRESRWLEIILNRVELDGEPSVIAVARDVTERRARQIDMEHRAAHDPLTGLPDWGLLRERIQNLLREFRGSTRPLALFIVSLSRYREIRNILGPEVANEVLRLVARRLVDGLPEDALVARHGGDEFSVFLPGINSEHAEQWARRISAMMLRSYHLSLLPGNNGAQGGVEMDVDFNIGVALFPEDDDRIDGLMRKAGVAAQIGQTRSTGIAFYERDFDRRDADRLLLAGQLRRAIAEDSLQVYFQPIVDIRERALLGVECQARWFHPQRGEVPPEQFIPLAEQTGLIRFLDHWVLEQGLKQFERWKKAGIELVISVNLSTRTLDDPQLVQAVQQAVERWLVDPRCLRLEITESALMANPEQSLERLRGVAAGGIAIALDDFGTGYSSLAYLKRLPLDCLKIDQSFVREMRQDESDAVIVRSTIELAHNLGLKVVAEGVEDEETWRMLAALGCDSAQGWLISPAVSPDEFDAWMNESKWATGIR